MLTALNRPDDIVYGFNLGADDYITKPFTFREVEVRLQAILRRVYWSQERVEPSVLTANEIVLNDDARMKSRCAVRSRAFDPYRIPATALSDDHARSPYQQRHPVPACVGV
jgi:DNA-binding response OmpR family regulator